MPVTLTVDNFAKLMRIDYLDADQRFVLGQYLAEASALVTKVAPAGVPDAVLNGAVSRVAGYMLDAPNSPDTPTGQALLSRLGVVSALAPWRTHRALGADTPTGRPAGVPLPGAPAAGLSRLAVQNLVDDALDDYSTTAEVHTWVQARGYRDQGQINAQVHVLVDPVQRAVAALQGNTFTRNEVLAEIAAGANAARPDIFEKDTTLLAGETRALAASNTPLALAAAVPLPKRERRIRMTVFDTGGDGSADLTATFERADMKVTPVGADPLDDTDSLRFVGASGNVYRVGRTAAGHFAVSCDTVGTYRFAFVQDDVNVTDYVDFPPKQTRLEPAAFLPAPPGYAQGLRQDGIPLGTLQAYDGDLYELVPRSTDRNIMRGVATAPAAGRVGLAGQFTWASPASGAAGAYRGWLPKTLYAQRPVGPGFRALPATIYAVAATDDGERVSGVPLQRSAANDTPMLWAYRNTTNEAGFEGARGDRVRIEFYGAAAGGQLSSPLLVHNADRWERYVDLVDTAVVRAFARSATSDGDARAALATLVNGATQDSERIDYAALKNKPAAPQPLSIVLHAGNVDTVVRSQTTQETLLAAVSSGYTIPAHGAGLILGRVAFSIVGTTTPAIGFRQRFAVEPPNPPNDFVFNIELLLSSIRRSAAFASNQGSGVLLAQVPIWSSAVSSAALGNLRLYLARDASNNVGIYRRYEAASGAATRTATTVRAAVNLSLLRTDGG